MLGQGILGFGASKRQIGQQNLELFRDITDDVEEDEFVPYAAFWDYHTIVTKNGEVCQTIKVTGLKRETLGNNVDTSELRALIRSSLKRHVPNDSFAVWLHTIRKNSSVDPGGTFPEGSFVEELNDSWIQENNFENQFVNEVFITIVHEGQNARLNNIGAFLRGLLPSRELRGRERHIDMIRDVLNDTVERVLADLTAYGARRLSIYKENGVYYSEQLHFLEKLINFVDRPMPVPEMDLSTYLTTGEITFAFNAMEVRTALGKRRFASILTLKEYKEASLDVIDKFLQLPMEFIVTQCIYFVNPEKVLFEYQELYNYQRLSEDNDISRLSELSKIIESNENSPNDFGEQQLTIFILSDTINLLEENMHKTIHYFAHYGMVAVREDIKFEETYWAQLPGNFVFVSRMQPTNTAHVAGFANLHNLPVGQSEQLHWGEPVTVFHTASDTPYYFNFHQGNVGHTCMTGPASTGKHVLTHFLLAQCFKFSPRIYYFEIAGRAKSFTRAAGGAYLSVRATIPEDGQPYFNPFMLTPSDANKNFLLTWWMVLARAQGYAPGEEDKQALAQAIRMIYEQPEAQRHFGQCFAQLQQTAPALADALAPWASNGQYGHLFTATGRGKMAGDTTLMTVELQEIVGDVTLQATIMPLLLQFVTDGLDGRPTMLVMEEAWHLLIQTHVTANLHGWLDHLTAHNAMVLAITEDIDASAHVPTTKQLSDAAATHMFMPDEDPSEAYMEIFGLEEEEYTYLEFMDIDERHFMVKHGGETVIGEMKMNGLEPYAPLLAGEEEPASV